MTNRERYHKVIEYFEETMPTPETELAYNNPFSLLVAVILSAQCTDKRVNLITPPLLNRYPDAEAMASATHDDIFNLIRSCSYPNNKAKHLVGMANKLLECFNGIVPSEPSELIRLPGVGRKTANVIASVVFNKPVMAVDTHVFRVAARLGLTKNAKKPLDTELQLTANIPEALMHKAHHWLILHGRYVCHARKPACEKCGLSYLCVWFSKTNRIAK
jgi:endonuclease III